MRKKVNGSDPKQTEMQKVLRELESPELKAILNAERPQVPRNRMAARAQGAQNRLERLQQMEERTRRINAFRSATCDKWFKAQIERLLGRWVCWVFLAPPLRRLMRRLLFQAALRAPWVMFLFGYSCHAWNGAGLVQDKHLPVSVLRVRWFGWTVARVEYAWEASK